MSQNILRNFSKKLTSSLANKDITFLIGARQVGKTTIFKELATSIPNSTYISLEPYWNTTFYTAQDLLDFLKTHNKIKDQTILFLDEVQVIENISIILKLLHDEYDYKIFAAGSGSLSIFRGITESMAGRFEEFFLYPFSWSEYQESQNMTPPSEYNQSPSVYNLQKDLFFTMLQFGSYPRIALTKNPQTKIRLLHNMYQAYIEKDIIQLFSREIVPVFDTIYRKIASNTASLLKIDSICKATNIKRQKVLHVIDILKSTFLIHLIPPLTTNPYREISKHSKVYFVDNGMLSNVYKQFNISDTQKGQRIENWVINEIIRTKPHHMEVFFWQKKNETEVDFVLKNVLTGKYIPIEVKSKYMSYIPKNLQSFYNDYQEKIDCMVVLHDGMYEVRKYESITVVFLPWFEIGYFLVTSHSLY